MDQCSIGIAVPEPDLNPELVSECAALLMAKESLDPTGLLNWSPNVPVDKWEGIAVDDRPGRVVHIYLSNKGLSGRIPKELAHLRALDDLVLQYNQLSGGIPPELGLLENLEGLALGNNRLTGQIPPEIANLDKLLVAGAWRQPVVWKDSARARTNG